MASPESRLHHGATSLGDCSVLSIDPTEQSPRTRYRGVEWDKCVKKWRARITLNGRKVSLGNFSSEDDAARAYNEAVLLKGAPRPQVNMGLGDIDPTSHPPIRHPDMPSLLTDNVLRELQQLMDAQRHRPDETSDLLKSPFRGVTWDRRERKWRARITILGKHKAIGRYHNQLEAALSYDKTALDLLGSSARPNFPSQTREIVDAYYRANLLNHVLDDPNALKRLLLCDEASLRAVAAAGKPEGLNEISSPPVTQALGHTAAKPYAWPQDDSSLFSKEVLLQQQGLGHDDELVLLKGGDLPHLSSAVAQDPAFPLAAGRLGPDAVAPKWPAWGLTADQVAQAEKQPQSGCESAGRPGSGLTDPQPDRQQQLHMSSGGHGPAAFVKLEQEAFVKPEEETDASRAVRVQLHVGRAGCVSIDLRAMEVSAGSCLGVEEYADRNTQTVQYPAKRARSVPTDVFPSSPVSGTESALHASTFDTRDFFIGARTFSVEGSDLSTVSGLTALPRTGAVRSDPPLWRAVTTSGPGRLPASHLALPTTAHHVALARTSSGASSAAQVPWPVQQASTSTRAPVRSRSSESLQQRAALQAHMRAAWPQLAAACGPGIPNQQAHTPLHASPVHGYCQPMLHGASPTHMHAPSDVLLGVPVLQGDAMPCTGDAHLVGRWPPGAQPARWMDGDGQVVHTVAHGSPRPHVARTLSPAQLQTSDKGQQVPANGPQTVWQAACAQARQQARSAAMHGGLHGHSAPAAHCHVNSPRLARQQLHSPFPTQYACHHVQQSALDGTGGQFAARAAVWAGGGARAGSPMPPGEGSHGAHLDSLAGLRPRTPPPVHGVVVSSGAGGHAWHSPQAHVSGWELPAAKRPKGYPGVDTHLRDQRYLADIMRAPGATVPVAHGVHHTMQSATSAAHVVQARDQQCQLLGVHTHVEAQLSLHTQLGDSLCELESPDWLWDP